MLYGGVIRGWLLWCSFYCWAEVAFQLHLSLVSKLYGCIRFSDSSQCLENLHIRKDVMGSAKWGMLIPTLEKFFYCYEPQEIAQSKGFYNFLCCQAALRSVSDMPESNHQWKSRFFLSKGLIGCESPTNGIVWVISMITLGGFWTSLVSCQFHLPQSIGLVYISIKLASFFMQPKLAWRLLWSKLASLNGCGPFLLSKGLGKGLSLQTLSMLFVVDLNLPLKLNDLMSSHEFRNGVQEEQAIGDQKSCYSLC